MIKPNHVGKISNGGLLFVTFYKHYDILCLLPKIEANSDLSQRLAASHYSHPYQVRGGDKISTGIELKIYILFEHRFHIKFFISQEDQ